MQPARSGAVKSTHPADDGIHEDIKLVHAVEWRGNDTRQRKHKADGNVAALSTRQRFHVLGRLAGHHDFEFHTLLRVVQLDAPLELLPVQVPAATHAEPLCQFTSILSKAHQRCKLTVPVDGMCARELMQPVHQMFCNMQASCASVDTAAMNETQLACC